MSTSRTARAGRASRAAIAQIQAALRKLFFPIDVDGDFGPLTQQCVCVMQAARDLPVTGDIDAATRDSIIAASVAADRGIPSAGGESWHWKPFPGSLRGVHSGDDLRGSVALTFDDGPSPRYTPAILDILGACGVAATFYVQGVNAVRWPDLVRDIADRGHGVGNHSWDHPDFAWVTAWTIREQVSRTQESICRIAGDVACVVRPPYGSPFHTERSPYAECRPEVASALSDAGAAVMMWHIDSTDWKHEGRPDLVVKRFRAEVVRRGGGVVLMHDVHPQSVWALPGILDVIRQYHLTIARDDHVLARKYSSSGPAAFQEES
jgi:peptidoglycan/xylan/chitin deacetylase (PgdA/CDA1 family)